MSSLTHQQLQYNSWSRLTGHVPDFLLRLDPGSCCSSSSSLSWMMSFPSEETWKSSVALRLVGFFGSVAWDEQKYEVNEGLYIHSSWWIQTFSRITLLRSIVSKECLQIQQFQLCILELHFLPNIHRGKHLPTVAMTVSSAKRSWASSCSYGFSVSLFFSLSLAAKNNVWRKTLLSSNVPWHCKDWNSISLTE